MTPSKIGCVLLDLEGTIVPLEFVHRTLFPFAAQRLDAYLATEEAREQAVAWMAALRAEAAAQRWPGQAPALPPEEGMPESQALRQSATLLQWLIQQDIKSPVLKAIQGRIWRSGYGDGTLRGELFPGVAAGLRTLNQRGYRLAIFSSGSVEAQKLLMTHSTDGDLSGLITGWYDTAMGAKTDPGSYLRIAEQLGLDPQAILFGTDHSGEAQAAGEAGMAAALSLRGVTPVEAVANLDPRPVVVAEDIIPELLGRLT